MAKVTGPLMSMTARGTIGERLTFSVRKTGQQVRFQRSNIDANTFDQKTNRVVYQDAVAEWNLLSVEEKNIWKAQAVGLGMTGFNIFVKDYYMNTIRKLATVENIDFKVLGDTLVYTVPTGMKFIYCGYSVLGKICTGLIGDGVASIKRGSDNVILNQTSSTWLEGADMVYVEMSSLSQPGIIVVVPAGDTVEFEVTVVEGGTALVFDFDLIGYLIEV